MTTRTPIRILVIVGTPLAATLNHALAASYADAARSAGAEVRIIDLAADAVPPIPTERAHLRMPRTPDDVPLDPAVARYVDDLQWADHIAVLFPQWWGTMPGALKSFFDAVLLSGFAHSYHATGRGWDRLLAGRTARIVMTMDSPRFWNRLVYRNAAETSLKNAILRYCGITTIGITRFAEVRHTDAATRAGWIARAAALGENDAVRTGRASHSNTDRERATVDA